MCGVARGAWGCGVIPAEKATLKALRQARWCLTDAATILGEGVGTVWNRVHRSEELSALWTKHARKVPHRSGRPPRGTGLTIDAVRAALARNTTASAAARDLNVSREAVRIWTVKHPELRDVIGTAVEVAS